MQTYFLIRFEKECKDEEEHERHEHLMVETTWKNE